RNYIGNLYVIDIVPIFTLINMIYIINSISSYKIIAIVMITYFYSLKEYSTIDWYHKPSLIHLAIEIISMFSNYINLYIIIIVWLYYIIEFIMKESHCHRYYISYMLHRLAIVYCMLKLKIKIH
ncbi:unnamed protein product, partial [marine sediment metagenome]